MGLPLIPSSSSSSATSSSSSGGGFIIQTRPRLNLSSSPPAAISSSSTTSSAATTASTAATTTTSSQALPCYLDGFYDQIEGPPTTMLTHPFNTSCQHILLCQHTMSTLCVNTHQINTLVTSINIPYYTYINTPFCVPQA